MSNFSSATQVPEGIVRGSEKVLTAELLIGMVILTVAKIREQNSMPTPSQYIGIVSAYTILAAVALFGRPAARLAGGLGALVLLAIVLAHGANAFAGIASATSASKNATVKLSPTAMTSNTATNVQSTISV